MAVPSRAQFEPGFYRWLERLSRLAGNLDCRIAYHGRQDTLTRIRQYKLNHHEERPRRVCGDGALERAADAGRQIFKDDHIFVVVTARKGTVSFKNAMERLPEELTKYFSGKNLMIIFPDQFGEDKTDVMTFAEPQHVEDRSAYEAVLGWLYHNLYHRLAVAAKKIIRKTKKK